jgi:hypothetical protein
MSAFHPIDALPELAAGRLPVDEAASVQGHVDTCASCRADLHAWRAVAEAVRDRSTAVAAPADLLARIVGQVEGSSAARWPVRHRLRWLLDFVVGQIPIVRREIWPASAMLIATGAVVSLLLTGHASAGTVMALFAPLAAAVGLSLVYGPDNDPGLELALAAPVSPRLVLVARMTLVVGWDLALALTCTLLLGALGGGGPLLPLVAMWLGPMLILGCLCLALAVALGTRVAIAVAMALWAARILEVSRPSDGLLAPLTPVLDAIWQSDVAAIAIAAVALAVSVWLIPRLGVGAALEAG